MSYKKEMMCDFESCNNKIDCSEMCVETYHTLDLGGSDFEMSFNAQREFHFCSLMCIVSFIQKTIDEQEKL